MINFSKIPNQSFFGLILRAILKIIPANTTVRILQGKLMGKKWTKGSGVNGYWLGTYELEKQKLFEKIIKNGDVIFDIGAQAGFFTLLAAEFAGREGKVFAFEPLPRNFNYLKKHIEINHYKNIFSYQMAISDQNGTTFFRETDNLATGHLTENNGFKTNIASLDCLIKNKKLSIPNVIKIDVEGEEFNVLNGAYEILKNHHPVIFLAIHNEKEYNNCIKLLKSLNYVLQSIGNDKGEFLAIKL